MRKRTTTSSADGFDLSLTEGPKQTMRDSLLFCFCCFVGVFFTLALFRNPFVYCCVYIHPQAFYKILLYCILLSYTCYSLRALFTMITHCVSVCVIWKLFGARRINHDRNKPDRVFLKKKKSPQASPSVSREFNNQSERSH